MVRRVSRYGWVDRKRLPRRRRLHHPQGHRRVTRGKQPQVQAPDSGSAKESGGDVGDGGDGDGFGARNVSNVNGVWKTVGQRRWCRRRAYV